MKPGKFVCLSFLLVGMFFSTKTFGQFSGGLELGLPLGTFSDFANPGVGLTARYEGSIMDKINWTAATGFIYFSGKSIYGGSYGNSLIIPFLAGGKYYVFENNKGLYGSAELGFNFITYGTVSTVSGTSFGTASTTRLSFAPGAGYRLGQFDFSGKLSLQSDFSYLSLRAAYIFGKK